MSQKPKSTEELLTEISGKLDQIIAVLATQGRNIDAQIDILQNFGWEWDKIGKFVGMKGDAQECVIKEKNRLNLINFFNTKNSSNLI